VKASIFNNIKLLLQAVFNNSYGLVSNLQTLPQALSSHTYSMNLSQLSNNEPEPEHKRLRALNSQTRLLRLPPELRDAIYDRVLRSRDIINFTGPFDSHRLKKPLSCTSAARYAPKPVPSTTKVLLPSKER
jgi:hypothetical protein